MKSLLKAQKKTQQTLLNAQEQLENFSFFEIGKSFDLTIYKRNNYLNINDSQFTRWSQSQQMQQAEVNYKKSRMSYKRKSLYQIKRKTAQQKYRMHKSVCLRTNKINLSPKIKQQTSKNHNFIIQNAKKIQKEFQKNQNKSKNVKILASNASNDTSKNNHNQSPTKIWQKDQLRINNIKQVNPQKSQNNNNKPIKQSHTNKNTKIDAVTNSNLPISDKKPINQLQTQPSYNFISYPVSEVIMRKRKFQLRKIEQISFPSLALRLNR